MSEPSTGARDMTGAFPVAEAEKPFARLLAEALPEHTHVTAPLFGFGEASWTWTTPEGVWTVTRAPVSAWYTLSGEQGRWTVDAARVVPVLRALGAIPDGPPAHHDPGIRKAADQENR